MWCEENGPPQHIFLTNRLHDRDSFEIAATLNAKVWCNRSSLHEFEKDQRVELFNHGDDLPGGVRALEVGVLCPEETALYIPLAGGILAIADAIVRDGDDLGFVPDYLLGDDPEDVKRGLREVFTRHLDIDFDHLLFAHGSPWIGGAKEGLRRFLERLQI